MSDSPYVSIIVVIFNMNREVKRTFHSLSSAYQCSVTGKEYEVIVVDNGSATPLSDAFIKSFGNNFKYHYLSNPSISPVKAINYGVKQSKGQLIGIMIDGARILTPGILKYAIAASQMFKNPLIATLGWYIEPKAISDPEITDYDSEKEDLLFKDINWPKDPYRLFEISRLMETSNRGWFMPSKESNCLFMPRNIYEKLGGYDERFVSRGGGASNTEFFSRACHLPGSELIIILGEGTFHQFHNGVISNSSSDEKKELVASFRAEYKRITNTGPEWPKNKIFYIGHMPKEAEGFLEHSINILNAEGKQ